MKSYYGKFPESPKQKTIEDCVAEVLSRYKGIKSIRFIQPDPSLINCQIRIDGVVNGQYVGHICEFDMRPYVNLNILDSDKLLSEEIERIIKEAGVFTELNGENTMDSDNYKFSGPQKIKNSYRKLVEKFPNDTYGSYSGLFGRGLQEGVITQQQYDEAREYYGRLWFYAGD